MSLIERTRKVRIVPDMPKARSGQDHASRARRAVDRRRPGKRHRARQPGRGREEGPRPGRVILLGIGASSMHPCGPVDVAGLADRSPGRRHRKVVPVDHHLGDVSPIAAPAVRHAAYWIGVARRAAFPAAPSMLGMLGTPLFGLNSWRRAKFVLPGPDAIA